MVMKMLRNDYGMIILACCLQFHMVSVVVGWWLMVDSLYLKSLCLWTSYTDEASYSGTGYSGDTSEGGSGRGYTGSGGGVHGGERYSDGGSYDGYSGDDREAYGEYKGVYDRQKMTFARFFKFTCNFNDNISNYPLPIFFQEMFSYIRNGSYLSLHLTKIGSG